MKPDIVAIIVVAVLMLGGGYWYDAIYVPMITPDIMLTSPEEGYSSSYVRVITEIENERKAENVEYYIDGVLRPTDGYGLTYGPSLSVHTDSPGEHTVKAVLVNKDGSRVETETVTFTLAQ